MATILVVEDEFLIAGEIIRALKRLGHSPIEPSVATSDDALAALVDNPVELVLMDINIAGDCDGIATALVVRRQYQIPVVFLSARSDPATLNRAKVAQPAGYLVKPFTDDSLRAVLTIALHNTYDVPPTRTSRQTLPADELNAEEVAFPDRSFTTYLFVRDGNSGFKRIEVSDILYFEAMQNYVNMQTKDKKYVFDSTLKELEKKLPSCFCKTHRSYIVNLDRVESFEEGCVSAGGTYVPVSRTFKEDLKTRIHLLG